MKQRSRPRARAALVTPLSGPLALYGRAGAEALALVDGLDLSVSNAHPDPAAAMHGAVATGPDLVFGPYGSGPALAAASATARVIWNHGGSNSALSWPAFPHVVNVLAPAAAYWAGAVAAVRVGVPEAAIVTLVRAASGFAADVAAGARRAATGFGFTVSEVVFEPGSPPASAATVPPGDVLLTAGAFADELALARALLPGRWRVAGFVGAGTDEVLADLGPLLEGLIGAAQWIAAAAPSPTLGPDAAWFTAAYRAATGHDPAYPAVQAFAAGVLALHCWREAGGDEAAMLAAATALDATTCYGRFRLDPATGLQAGHQPVTVQWQDGARRVIWPADHAEAALRPIQR